MRARPMKRIGVAGLVAAAITMVVTLGTVRLAAVQHPADGEKTLQGTWWVQVTTLSDCASRVPVASFAAVLTFAQGGTMTGTTTNNAFAVGQRSPDHGVWERLQAPHTYRARSVALILFSTAPNFPVTPGFQAGSQRLDQTIEIVDADHFSSDATTAFFDAAGQEYRSGCATARGQRIE